MFFGMNAITMSVLLAAAAAAAASAAPAAASVFGVGTTITYAHVRTQFCAKRCRYVCAEGDIFDTPLGQIYLTSTNNTEPPYDTDNNLQNVLWPTGVFWGDSAPTEDPG